MLLLRGARVYCLWKLQSGMSVWRSFICVQIGWITLCCSVLEEQLAADPDEKASIHTWKKQIEGVDDCDYALDLLQGKGSSNKLTQAKAEEQEELETCYPDRMLETGR